MKALAALFISLGSACASWVESAPTSIAVPNAGFEVFDGKALAWRVSPEMQVVRGVRHNGSAGLRWQSAKPSTARVAAETPIRLWRKDGRLYVLACNAAKIAQTLAIEVGKFTRLEGVESGNAASVRVDCGKAISVLPPNGYSMARMAAETLG